MHRQVHEHALSCPVSTFHTYAILIFFVVDGFLVYVLSRVYILHNRQLMVPRIILALVQPPLLLVPT